MLFRPRLFVRRIRVHVQPIKRVTVDAQVVARVSPLGADYGSADWTPGGDLYELRGLVCGGSYPGAVPGDSCGYALPEWCTAPDCRGYKTLLLGGPRRARRVQGVLPALRCPNQHRCPEAAEPQNPHPTKKESRPVAAAVSVPEDVFQIFGQPLVLGPGVFLFRAPTNPEQVKPALIPDVSGSGNIREKRGRSRRSGESARPGPAEEKHLPVGHVAGNEAQLSGDLNPTHLKTRPLWRRSCNSRVYGVLRAASLKSPEP